MAEWRKTGGRLGGHSAGHEDTEPFLAIVPGNPVDAAADGSHTALLADRDQSGGPLLGTKAHAKDTEPPSNIRKDLGRLILLILLYTLQGVPLGLTFGSIPFLLKSKTTYKDIALFSLTQYPYSLKLLWSPVVDSYYVPRFGRRKSWIVPIQAITGIALILMGTVIDEQIAASIVPVNTLALGFTILVLLCATQDIAVDGWALTLLSEENKAYASTAQTIGLNTGYFLSFTVFLALNSTEFCNKYLRTTPMDQGVLQLGGYLMFWGICYLLCDVFLLFYDENRNQQSQDEDEDSGLRKVYTDIIRVIRMPHMLRLIAVLMVAKIGFVANEAVTGLRLLELGLQKEDLALAVLLDFPFQIMMGYYTAKWSKGDRPLRPWLYAFAGRLAMALGGMGLVYGFPADGVVTPHYFVIIMASMVLGSFMSTVQFVGLGSFFTVISDPSIGGTYMTLLNTLSNLGGTWPRYFVLRAVDMLSQSECRIPASAAANGTRTGAPPLANGTALLTDGDRAACKAAGGAVNTLSDGYFAVSGGTLLLGLAITLFFIVPSTLYLERLPTAAWRLPPTPAGGSLGSPAPSASTASPASGAADGRRKDAAAAGSMGSATAVHRGETSPQRRVRVAANADPDGYREIRSTDQQSMQHDVLGVPHNVAEGAGDASSDASLSEAESTSAIPLRPLRHPSST